MLMTSAFFQFVTLAERKFSIKMETLVLILLGQTAGALNNRRDTCDYIISGHKETRLAQEQLLLNFHLGLCKCTQCIIQHESREIPHGAASHANLSLGLLYA
jgi:hypothetical protein